MLKNPTRIKRFGCLVGNDKQMRQVYAMIEKAASVDMPTLIVGETGCGKELVARELHDRSSRGKGPFVAVNTGAISDELVASELFGHTKGAFTGAVGEKAGSLREADHGSIFLDEIGTMDERVQVSLLRVLDSKQFRPLGAKNDIAIDFRLIAATNENLEDSVEHGYFREDLLYRLQVLSIKLPPLRDRPSDIPMLCEAFIENINAEYHFQVDGISDAALKMLEEYEWPGNIRELKNVIAQAAVLVEAGTIDCQHLPERISNIQSEAFQRDEEEAASESAAPREDAPISLSGNGKSHQPRVTEDGVFIPIGSSLEDVQKEYLLKTLSVCGNNKTRAAKLLGISRKTLYDKLLKWGESDVNAS